MDRITVIGGGLAGLTAAITAAESGARVNLYESHHTLGGRARTAEGPYLTNDGPHVLYNGGPHWAWLKRRGLLGQIASVAPLEAARFRFRWDGSLRHTPPLALLKLARQSPETAPVDRDFASWAAGVVGSKAARAAANYAAVAVFHHDPGSLSAAFVQERLHRATALPPEARYPVGGWGALVDRMATRAWELGVHVETTARVDALPEDHGPVVVATSLDAARRLLGDDSLRWTSGRTALLDLGLSTRRGDPFVVSDLENPGWIERFTAARPHPRPRRTPAAPGAVPDRPARIEGRRRRARGAAAGRRVRGLAPAGRLAPRRAGRGRTGAVDLPGTTWRDRPAVDRGHGVFLAGDQVAAPGVLSEVAFASGIEAASLAVRSLRLTRA